MPPSTIKGRTKKKKASTEDAASPPVPSKAGSKKTSVKRAAAAAAAGVAADGALPTIPSKKGSKKKKAASAPAEDAADAPPPALPKKGSKKASVKKKVAAAAEDNAEAPAIPSKKGRTKKTSAKKARTATEEDADVSTPAVPPKQGSKGASAKKKKKEAAAEALEVDNSPPPPPPKKKKKGSTKKKEAAAEALEVDNSDLYNAAGGGASSVEEGAPPPPPPKKKKKKGSTKKAAKEASHPTEDEIEREALAAAFAGDDATEAAEEEVRANESGGIDPDQVSVKSGSGESYKGFDGADQTDSTAAASDTSPKMGQAESQDNAYECEFDCGFDGPTEGIVEQHEQRCARNPANVSAGKAGGEGETPEEETFGGFAANEDLYGAADVAEEERLRLEEKGSVKKAAAAAPVVNAVDSGIVPTIATKDEHFDGFDGATTSEFGDDANVKDNAGESTVTMCDLCDGNLQPAVWRCDAEGCKCNLCDDCDKGEHTSKKTKAHARTPVVQAPVVVIMCDLCDGNLQPAAWRCDAKGCKCNLCDDCDKGEHTSKKTKAHARTPVVQAQGAAESNFSGKGTQDATQKALPPTKKKKKNKKAAPVAESPAGDDSTVIDTQPVAMNVTTFPLDVDPDAPGPDEDLSNIDVKENELVKEIGEAVELRGIGAELSEEELKEKAKWEAEKEALFIEAQAKQKGIKAKKDAEAAAKKAKADEKAAKLAKQRAKLALKKAAEAAEEGGILETLRPPDRTAVAQTDAQAKEYFAKETALKATIEDLNSRVDGFDEANYAYWTDDGSDFDNDPLATQRQKAEATSVWLSAALECTYFGHSPFHKDDRSESEVTLNERVKALLASRFARELEHMQQFEALKERLGVRCKDLGVYLKEAHDDQLLKFKLSNKRVKRFWKLHKLAATPTQMDKDGKPTLTNCDIMPGLDTGLGIFDYQRPEQMGEMVAMQVVMLSARAANDKFQDAIRETIKPFADIETKKEFQAAPPKTFARPYNKGISEDDYRYESLPRGAGNCKDSVRNLICVKTGADLLGLIKALSDRFGGLGKLKNPYGYDDKRKDSQCHLLLMNITIVYTDDKTYGATFSKGSQTKEIKKMLKDYKGKLQMLPRDRWDASIDTALEFMTETSLASEPVRVLAEVQVLFSYDMLVREAMHDLYDVQRAVTAEQLAADKSKSKDLEAEVVHATKGVISLENCCIPEPSGGTVTVLRLIEQNADVHEVMKAKGMFSNSQGGSELRTYVYMAAENNHPDVLQVFIDHGVDIEAECGAAQQTALAAAAHNGHTDCVKVLLNANANVHHTDLVGETPIFRAAYSCKVDTVQALLDAGANCTDEGLKRSNPLFYAAQGRGKLVTEGGVDRIEYKNDPGGALVIKLLIENGASPKVAMDGSRTPLHDAVKYGCPKAVKMLLEYGALIEAAEDNTLMTPIVEGANLAETPHHIDCIRILAENDPPANVLHMSRLGTPKRIAEDNLVKKGKESGTDSKAYEFQQRVVNVMKEIVAGSVKHNHKNENEIAIKEVETEEKELFDYITYTGIEDPEVAHASMIEVDLGTFKLCERSFKSVTNAEGEKSIPGRYLLESVLSDYTKDETLKLIDALVDKKAFKDWRHSRQSKTERKDIKKQRRRNSQAMEENEKVEVKLRRNSAAQGFSLDALVNINQSCKEHREKYGHNGKKGDLIALPGTPNLPEESTIRTMLRDGANGCCCACLVGEGAYVAADEGAFENINVAVEWTYTLTTRYALRYLRQYIVNGNNSHPARFDSYDGPDSIDFHSLNNVYDFSDSAVCGACVGSNEGLLLAGSAFKKTCVKCKGVGTVKCSSCSGNGKKTCSSCGGSKRGYDGETCYSCNGTGKTTCGTCGGSGRVTCPDCRGGKYFAGWLAVCNYDGASKSPYALGSGVGNEWQRTRNVKQKGSSKLVKDSKTTKSYDVDDDNGPAHPSASSSSRIQPLKCTADKINKHSVDFIATDNATNFYTEKRSALTTRDIDAPSRTFGSISEFTSHRGKPGFRLRGQNQKIEWEACAEMGIDVESLGKPKKGKEYALHLSGTELDIPKIKNYPRGGCCNWGLFCCGCSWC